jgi:hypothetical protein
MSRYRARLQEMKGDTTLRIGRFEKGLGLMGLAVLLFGISFVRGAIREDEPEAAARGSQLFGGISLSLTLLAVVVAWARSSRSITGECE